MSLKFFDDISSDSRVIMMTAIWTDKVRQTDTAEWKQHHPYYAMLCGYHLSRGRPISEIVSSAQPMEAGSTRHYKSHTKLTILLQAIVFNFVASHSSCQNYFCCIAKCDGRYRSIPDHLLQVEDFQYGVIDIVLRPLNSFLKSSIELKVCILYSSSWETLPTATGRHLPHSVTCHPTQVNAPALTPASKLVHDLELDWVESFL